MTRLMTEWISGIEQEIKIYDCDLKRKTNMNLAELSAAVSGLEADSFSRAISQHRVAVVPVTVGEGVIGAFSESVAAIMKVMGVDAFVTDKTDVSGIREGIIKGADILFMADDVEYIALNVRTGKVVDNNIATAMGYITLLEQMAGTLKDKDVLVIGCGIVGSKATDLLCSKEARITLYDKNIERLQDFADKGIATVTEDSEIRRFHYILDATTEGGWLHREMMAEEVLIAALGVPLSLDKQSFKQLEKNVVHDLLQIGTAVMFGLVLSF